MAFNESTLSPAPDITSLAGYSPPALDIIRKMTKTGLLVSSLAIAGVLGPSSNHAFAQHAFEIVTGKPFDSAMPKDFYLEGNAIPTEKRNAALIHLPSGVRALFALIDTTGYSADIIAKYVGMLITEGDISVCGHTVNVGSYGFGWTHPPTGAEGGGKFSLYDQSGAKIAECASSRDAAIKQPRPLQVVIAPDGSAHLYYGRQNLDLK